MDRLRTISFSLALALILPSSAFAQETDSLFLREKRDLAGVLGQVHYIRTLCNGQGDQYWRDFMFRLLDLEAVTESRRSLLIKAFNHGYKNQGRLMPPNCSSEAPIMEKQLARQGRRLAETIAVGYLN